VDEEFEQITVLRLPRDFGKSRARNIGVRTAKADLLLFADPRVHFDPAAVHGLVEALERDEQAAAATPQFRTPDGKRISGARALPDSGMLREASLGDGALPASDRFEAIADWAFLLRRPVLKGMNGFDEKRFSEFWGELEVCWQIRNAGKKIIEAAGAGAILHETVERRDPALLAADRVSGAAAYVGKHHGFGAGLMFRISCALSALFSGRLSLLASIVSCSRVDPT
jgi:GT2 family glycosyltransferase